MEVADVVKRTGAQVLWGKRRGKYNAQRTRGYASKREAAYAAELELLKRAGKVTDWIEQVAVKLPGGLKYVCDFVVFYPDNSYRFVEVKGHETQEWRMKLRLLEAERPEIFKRLEVVS